MLVVYWKWKVWQWLKKLLTYLDKSHILMNDKDIDLKKLSESNKIIASPGIPAHHQIYKNFWNKIISELSFIWQVLEELWIRQQFTLIWISWTNGKSTTTRITYELLRKTSQNKVHLSGNFWTPFSETLTTILNNNTKLYQTIVLEVSSFMLYKLNNFKFDYSILTNIATDHLDRHTDFEDYKQSKLNLIKNTKKQAFILQDTLQSITQDIPKKITTTFWYDYNLESTQFVWYHNKANIQSVFLLAKTLIKNNELQQKTQDIKTTINSIQPLPHRLQKVKTINWISIYDDGICTSSHAQKHAIQSFTDPVILIAWGYDKWDNFNYLSDLYKKHIAYGIFIWTTTQQFAQIFTQQNIPFFKAKTLNQAIKESIIYAKKTNTNTILFSPWCASFDMFKNVYDRIEQFTKLIQNMSI